MSRLKTSMLFEVSELYARLSFSFFPLFFPFSFFLFIAFVLVGLCLALLSLVIVLAVGLFVLLVFSWYSSKGF